MQVLLLALLLLLPFTVRLESTPHAYGAGNPHGHTHGTLDPALFTSRLGIRARKCSLGGLLETGDPP